MDCYIYMLTYKGQWDGRKGESPYTWIAHSYTEAEQMKKDLEAEYPSRVWSIGEKDVS